MFSPYPTMHPWNVSVALNCGKSRWQSAVIQKPVTESSLLPTM